MTTAFGAPQAGSIETKSLRAIDSRQQSFVNKDFVKNISWLNNSVDTLSTYTQLLQKGVDQANQNIIEQIQGFIADLIVIFAGGEPTGIELGDLKYIFQALGAIFGINPDTPFPLNLLEAVGHMFGNFLAPLPQFTDLIFDAMAAWAEDLGFTPEVVQSIQDLNTALTTLSINIVDFFSNILDLFSILGELPIVGWLWDLLMVLFDGLDSISLKPIFEALSYIAVPVINSLTWVVEVINSIFEPLGNWSAGGVGELGNNALPTVSGETTIWNVGSNESTLWIYDTVEKAFRTTGNSTTKRIITQNPFAVTPGSELEFKGNLKWSGIPSASQGLRLIAVFYSDTTEISTITIQLPSGHGATGGYSEVSQVITVPAAVNKVRAGAVVDTTVTTGSVWAKDLSLKLKGKMELGLIDGLLEFLDALVPWEFFDAVLGTVGSTIDDILNFFGRLLKPDSPIDAWNLFGTPHPSLFDLIGLGSISDKRVNFLSNPDFIDASSVAGAEEWFHDPSKTASDNEIEDAGSVYVDADGFEHNLYSNAMSVVPGQKVEMTIFTQWSGYVGTAQPIQLICSYYSKGQEVSTETLDAIGPATASTTTWFELSKEIPVPDTNGEEIQTDIEEVRLLLRVTSGATAGRIWFSKGDMSKGVAPRVAPIEWIKDLPEVLEGIDEFVQGVIDVLIEIIDGIPIFGGTLADLFRFVWEWFEDTLATAAQAADAIFGVGGIIDTIVTSLFGWIGSGFGLGDGAQALEDTAETIATLSTSVQELQNKQTQLNTGGKSIFVDITTYPNSTHLPADWAQTYSGAGTQTYGVTSGAFCWDAAVGSDRLSSFILTKDTFKTATDYQMIGSVFGGSPKWFNSFSQGYDTIRGRISDDGTSWIEARFGKYNMWLYRVVSGVYTLMDEISNSADGYSHKSNSAYWLECGTIGGLRQFRVWEGNRILLTHTEVGTASIVGATARRVGGSAFINASVLGYNTSGKIVAFAASDNYPTEIVGSGATLVRTSTGTVSVSSGLQTLPDNFYNSATIESDDITSDPVTGRHQVSITGWYEIEFRTATSAFTTSTYSVNGPAPFPIKLAIFKGYGAAAPTLDHYVGDIVRPYGYNISASSSSDIFYVVAPEAISGNTGIYLLAGEWVEMGYDADASKTGFLTGDSAGTETFFAIRLANRSLA